MTETSNIFVPNKRTLRISRLGDKDLHELGWVSPDGRDMPSARHHVDSDRWLVIFPLTNMTPVIGSGRTIRDAYRLACRQQRLLSRPPEHLVRSRARAMRYAWSQRQRAMRYGKTIARQLLLIAELRQQIEDARREASPLNQRIGELMLENNRLRHEVDYFRRQRGLPTYDELKVFAKPRPPEPVREPRQIGSVRIHAALLPPGVTVEDIISAIEVLPASTPKEPTS